MTESFFVFPFFAKDSHHGRSWQHCYISNYCLNIWQNPMSYHHARFLWTCVSCSQRIWTSKTLLFPLLESCYLSLDLFGSWYDHTCFSDILQAMKTCLFNYICRSSCHENISALKHYVLGIFSSLCPSSRTYCSYWRN